MGGTRKTRRYGVELVKGERYGNVAKILYTGIPTPPLMGWANRRRGLNR
jgi:hypothetical protein